MQELYIDFSIFSEKYWNSFINDFLWIKYDDFCEKWWKINNNTKWAVNNEYIWIKKSWINHKIDEIDTHLDALFKILFPLKDKLLQLKEKWFDFQLSIVIYNYCKANPWYYIEPKYIEFLWKIWCSINNDIYCLNWED